MVKRLLLCVAVLVAPLWAHADLAADIAASTGSVTITSLATQVDEPVVFLYVKGSDLPPDFWAALDAASDTDFHTVFATTGDGSTRLPTWVTLPNTSTDTAGIWIRALETMSASVDVDYMLWAGNAAMSTPGATDPYGRDAVFGGTGGYVGGYMPGLLHDDITGGGRTLTAVNSPGTAASGYEGITAASYTAASSMYHHYNGTQGVTGVPASLEVLAYDNNTTANYVALSLANTSSGTPNQMYVRFSNSGDTATSRFAGATGVSVANTSTSFTATTWRYLATTRDANSSGTTSVYLDGGGLGTETTNITAHSGVNSLGIGALVDSSADSFLDGRVAATFLSNSVRSAGFIATNKRNFDGALYSAGAWVPADTCNSGSTGWVLFQTAATTSASGTLVDWTNTGNALVDDANYATATLDPVGNYESEYLNLTNINYGTTVPTSADSYTVTVRIKRARATGGGDDISDLTVQFIDETGTRIGDNVADTLTNWPTTAASVDYTITGHTFDGTEFDADSGLAIRATGIDSATDCDARVLVAWIKIDWNCGDDAAKARGFFALTE